MLFYIYSKANSQIMASLKRRTWLKSLSVAGAGAITLHPKDILELIPDDTKTAKKNSIIRLSSNENPYSPSTTMQEVIQNFGSELCRYPNQFFSDLEYQIAEKEGIDPAHIVITSGSREGLKAVGMMKSMKGNQIITCLPTYRALIDYADFIGADIKALPLDKDMLFDLSGIEEAIDDQTSMVFVCNPNNPTGTLLEPEYLTDWCIRTSKKTTVFVDEIYYDYIETQGYPSMKSLVLDGHDVIIARTLSKVYGLAGIRIGYMIASKETAEEIRTSLHSGPNILAIRLAQAALKDEEFYEFSLKKNQQAKQIIYRTLDAVGLRYIKSHTNFVFFHTGLPIEEVHEKYVEQGILVGRPFPPFMDWCRVSTGSIEEVEKFARASRLIFS